MKFALKILVAILPAAIFLCAWQMFVQGDARLEFLFASPRLIGAIAAEELPQASIWNDLFITSSEAFLGLLIGSLLGTAQGLLLWTNERMAKIAYPYIVLLSAIPIFAIAPMLIIWFGIGLLSKIIMSAFAVFFVALSQAYEGARYCAVEHGHYARSLGATRPRMVTKIIVPGALRWVTAGFKVNIELALVGAFIGEFVSSQAGLGHYILTAGSLYDMPRVLFGVALISLLALAMSALIWMLERWKPYLFARG